MIFFSVLINNNDIKRNSTVNKIKSIKILLEKKRKKTTFLKNLIKKINMGKSLLSVFKLVHLNFILSLIRYRNIHMKLIKKGWEKWGCEAKHQK